MTQTYPFIIREGCTDPYSNEHVKQKNKIRELREQEKDRLFEREKESERERKEVTYIFYT